MLIYIGKCLSTVSCMVPSCERVCQFSVGSHSGTQLARQPLEALPSGMSLSEYSWGGCPSTALLFIRQTWEAQAEQYHLDTVQWSLCNFATSHFLPAGSSALLSATSRPPLWQLAICTQLRDPWNGRPCISPSEWDSAKPRCIESHDSNRGADWLRPAPLQNEISPNICSSQTCGGSKRSRTQKHAKERK